MVMSGMTFLKFVLNDMDEIESIDNWVDMWHDTDGDLLGCSLQEYLGFTEQEYSIWITNPKYIYTIIENRKNDKKRSITNT